MSYDEDLVVFDVEDRPEDDGENEARRNENVLFVRFSFVSLYFALKSNCYMLKTRIYHLARAEATTKEKEKLCKE